MMYFWGGEGGRGGGGEGEGGGEARGSKTIHLLLEAHPCKH